MKAKGLVSILAAAALSWSILPAAAAQPQETTILFTHDLHSHFLPVQGEQGEEGGYARLKTAIDKERAKHPEALVLDGGDFSIGSLFQTLYTTEGAELRTMAAMGYDATTIGNHEFDHKGSGFGQMLTAAVASGDELPLLLCANYLPQEEDVKAAMEAYGVTGTATLERGGVTYGLFGLMGQDAHDCAPTSGFALQDPIETARSCVETLKEKGAEVIICLSHGGTNEDADLSEDEALAKAVPGIDVILSGHSHTTMEKPIQVGNTYIVSAGEYGKYLGVLRLRRGADGLLNLADYRWIAIDETIPADPAISALVEQWKEATGAAYLDRYGFSYDQVLTGTDFSLTQPGSGGQGNNGLGTLVADAYHWAMGNLAQNGGGDVITVTADGVLRAPLREGEITVSEAFDVLSMGVGEDGTSGFPLVEVYLTGRELKAVMEVDASVTPIMPAAQLYCSGVAYQFNTNRMLFNRLTDAWLEVPPYSKGFDGSRTMITIDDSALYRVVSGMYSAQMLGTVEGKTFGILALEPKDAQGVPITDFSAHVVLDKEGNELKEWYALASYLAAFGEEGIPQWYSSPHSGAKTAYASFSPRAMLTNLTWVSLVVYALALAFFLAVALLTRWLLLRKWRRS